MAAGSATHPHARHSICVAASPTYAHRARLQCSRPQSGRHQLIVLVRAPQSWSYDRVRGARGLVSGSVRRSGAPLDLPRSADRTGARRRSHADATAASPPGSRAATEGHARPSRFSGLVRHRRTAGTPAALTRRWPRYGPSCSPRYDGQHDPRWACVHPLVALPILNCGLLHRATPMTADRTHDGGTNVCCGSTHSISVGETGRRRSRRAPGLWFRDPGAGDRIPMSRESADRLPGSDSGSTRLRAVEPTTGLVGFTGGRLLLVSASRDRTWPAIHADQDNRGSDVPLRLTDAECGEFTGRLGYSRAGCRSGRRRRACRTR